MIDNEELLVALCGERKVGAFKEVKRTSMRLARVVRRVIADDLGGSLPTTGKQFLTTDRGKWRLAAKANTDNSTEEEAHRQLGARFVQVFGEVADDRRARGWIGVDELYALHGVKFDARRIVEKTVVRLRDEGD